MKLLIIAVVLLSSALALTPEQRKSLDMCEKFLGDATGGALAITFGMHCNFELCDFGTLQQLHGRKFMCDHGAKLSGKSSAECLQAVPKEMGGTGEWNKCLSHEIVSRNFHDILDPAKRTTYERVFRATDTSMIGWEQCRNWRRLTCAGMVDAAAWFGCSEAEQQRILSICNTGEAGHNQCDCEDCTNRANEPSQ